MSLIKTKTTLAFTHSLSFKPDKNSKASSVEVTITFVDKRFIDYDLIISSRYNQNEGELSKGEQLQVQKQVAELVENHEKELNPVIVGSF